MFAPMAIRSLGFVVVLAACGDPHTAGDAGSDAATPDLDQASHDLAGVDMNGVCNALANTAPVVQQTMVNSAMPTPTSGGTIQPGTYYLTDSKIYQGAPAGVVPQQLQEVQMIFGSTIQTVSSVAGSADRHDSRIFTVAGTALTITLSCGGSGSTSIGFDATSTQYTTYIDAAKTVNVWTKQ